MKNKNVIFTDFFDTIMFRHVHPYQIVRQMSKTFAHLGFCSDNEKYWISWNNACTELHKSNKEINYRDLYTHIYSDLGVENIKVDAFVDFCVNLEEGLEIGAQYANKKFIKYLTEEKARGKRIYILSDYHLSRKSIISFLKAKNICIDLFDDVFLSSDLDASKANGKMYDKVINLLEGVDKDDVLMIGDNRVSDGRNAIACGIDYKIIPNYWPRIKGQIRRRLHWEYSKRAFRMIAHKAYIEGSPYSEYSLVYCTFAKLLFDEVKSKGVRRLTFLSREGHFLKRMFSMYKSMWNLQDDIELSYMKCSRRASATVDEEKLEMLKESRISIRNYLKAYGYGNRAIEEMMLRFGIKEEQIDRCVEPLKNNIDFNSLIKNTDFSMLLTNKVIENKNAFSNYIKLHETADGLFLVDIGWKGNMQEMIFNYSESKTFGYYLGINETDFDLSSRKGLIFTSCLNSGIKSSYSQLLKANIQLYEQLAAAPHGSAIGYIHHGDYIEVLEEWSDNEKKFYNEIIKEKQEEMLLTAKGISAWCNFMSEQDLIKSCAKMILKSALFADKKRLEFLKKLDNAFFDNFGQESKGLNFVPQKAPISLRILFYPEEYTRYFAKIQRVICARNKKLNGLYTLFAYLLYGYVWSVSLIKENMLYGKKR